MGGYSSPGVKPTSTAEVGVNAAVFPCQLAGTSGNPGPSSSDLAVTEPATESDNRAEVAHSQIWVFGTSPEVSGQLRGTWQHFCNGAQTA